MARLISSCCLIVLLAQAQEWTPLARFAERKPRDQAPAVEGAVRVSGVVAMRPIHLWDYSLVAIQDDSGAGVALEAHAEDLAGLVPGDRVEATATAGQRAGLAVLRPSELRKTGSGPAPPPQRLTVAQLLRFVNLGRYVDVEAVVVSSGANAGGDVLVIGRRDETVSVFLPRGGGDRTQGLGRFVPGDRVRVTGLSSMYSPIPPHDRNFQVIVADLSQVKLVSKGWLLPPALIAWALVALLGTTGVWWWRERQMGSQRRVLRGIVTLSEDVLAAATAREIAQRVQRDLPRIFETAEADLLLFRVSDDVLVRVVTETLPVPLSIPVDAPIGTLPGAAALCLRNRAMLRIPDTRKSPILSRDEPGLPASAIFVPMFVQGELVGVLAMYTRRRLASSIDLEVALQHLGNQVAASLRLHERQQMRDQLLRSEKMAATGQLISGIASDLRTPLQQIARAADERGIADIGAEAERGLEMIDHLISFSRMEHREMKPLDLHALLSSLVDLRKPERDRKRIVCENSLAVAPVWVMADRTQMEQALLTLLVHAEHAAGSCADRTMRVGSRLLGRKLLVSVECAECGTEPAGLGDNFGFPVAQVIAQSHGGDLRYSSNGRSLVRFELELPVNEEAAEPSAAQGEGRGGRVFTCLLVEPDTLSQRKLLSMLAARGHRCIPASTAEEAADLVQRMQFDVIFCASRLPGLTWLELYHRIRRRIGAFALLSDSWDAEAAQTLKGGEGKVLTRPVEDRDLDDLLGFVEVRLAAARV